MILETMYKAMDFQRVVFCMREPKTDAPTGRFGLVNRVETLAKILVISHKPSTPDLFSAVCLKGADKGEMVLDDKGLALLKTLHNQAVMAFRQSI